MEKPLRSSDKYIRLNKNITNPVVIKMISGLSEEWLVTKKEAANRLVADLLRQEAEKRNLVLKKA